MPARSPLLNILSYLVAAVTTNPTYGPRLTCHNFTVPLRISTKNLWISPTLNISSAAGLEQFISGATYNVTVDGTYEIAGTFCEPSTQVSATRSSTLQVLVHGATYDRTYWTGLGAPGCGFDGDKYSWVETAAEDGYPTLFFDRIGTGVSAHPNPVNVTQINTNIEVVHGLIELARAGKIPGVSTQFSKVIVAAHSFGSQTTNGLTAEYPHDADAVILTGYSTHFVSSVPNVGSEAGFKPAPLVKPAEYGSLSKGYSLSTNYSGVQFLFFGPQGGYSTELEKFNFQNTGVSAIGEGLSSIVSKRSAPDFLGPVFVMDGEQDGVFCCKTATPASPKDCGQGTTSLSSQVRTLYPNATAFDYLNVPNTGHCINLHYSAQDAFRAAHNWLKDQGF